FHFVCPNDCADAQLQQPARWRLRLRVFRSCSEPPQGFWRITLSEHSYAISQLFSVPVTPASFVIRDQLCRDNSLRKHGDNNVQQRAYRASPYNDFISEGGKFWPRIKAVAEANNCVPNTRYDPMETASIQTRSVSIRAARAAPSASTGLNLVDACNA